MNKKYRLMLKKIVVIIFLIVSTMYSQSNFKVDVKTFFNDKVVYNINTTKNIYSIAKLNSENLVSSNLILNNYYSRIFTHQSTPTKSLLELSAQLRDVPYGEKFQIKIASDNDNEKKESKSFFKSEIFYFACAAVLAASVYCIWKKDDTPTNNNKTFGQPSLPQNNN